ncbi:hypothetical protein B0H11DRAFT_2107189 [Mycena galericulata]|nr:hypothetical protein B0H11DRAFT_2107189 [Mycena galericulata]
MASSSPRGGYPSVPTPIRAITTPLRSSVAPPIPPASQLYEPLAKAVLRRRLTNRIFLYTSLISAAGTAVWLFWIGRLAFARFCGASVALWVGGVLPVILLRKWHLTVTRTSAPSPLLLVQKSLAPPLSGRTIQAVQAHLFSALCVLALNAIVDPTLPVFIKSRKHPYTPHPVLVLLALSQSTLAILYVLRSVLRDVWVFPFRRPMLMPSVGAFLAPVILALLALPAALITLFVVLPLLRRVPIVSIPLRVIRTPHASVLRSLGRAWSLGVQTAGMWEVAVGIWGWSIGEPLRTTPSVRALVSGISVATTLPPPPVASSSGSTLSTPSSLSTRTSSAFLSHAALAAPAAGPPPEISIYTHLAYAELLALSSPSSSESGDGAVKARAEAFDVDGVVWARLVREALVLIGREYRVLLARGAPVSFSATSNAPPASPAPPQTPSTSTGGVGSSPIKPSPLLKQNIFAKPPPPSPAARVGAAFASGGPVEEVIAPLPIPIPNLQLDKWVPDWRAYVPVLRLPPWALKGLDAAMKMSLPRAWTQARSGRAVQGWVLRREVCVEAVGVLTHLICASLTEDRFGVVQRDIPRVLEALLEFLGAVEEAVEGLRPKAASGGDAGKAAVEAQPDVDAGKEKEKAPLTPEQLERARAEAEAAADLDEARAVLGDVGDALKEGVARIVRTFGDKLRAFRFPPRTATRLQGFVDYCA